MMSSLFSLLSAPATILRLAFVGGGCALLAYVLYFAYSHGAAVERAKQHEAEETVRETAREQRRATERLMQSRPVDTLLEERKWFRPD